MHLIGMKCIQPPCLFILLLLSLCAQKSSAQTKTRFLNYIHKINLSLTQAAKQGKIEVYFNDSLKRKMNIQEAMEAGNKLTSIDLAIPRDGLDSMVILQLNEDSIKNDLIVNYKVEFDSNLNKIISPRAIATYYLETFGNGVTYKMPLHWYKFSDLGKILSANQFEFLRRYVILKSFEKNNGYVSDIAPKDESFYAFNEFIELSTVTVINEHANEYICYYIDWHINNILYSKFQANKISLEHNKIKCNSEQFKKQHFPSSTSKMHNLKSPGNSKDIIDTIFYSQPTRFDSIALHPSANKVLLKVYQRKYFEIEDYTGFEWKAYGTDWLELRKYLNPMLVRMVELIYEN